MEQPTSSYQLLVQLHLIDNDYLKYIKVPLRMVSWELIFFCQFTSFRLFVIQNNILSFKLEKPLSLNGQLEKNF